MPQWLVFACLCWAAAARAAPPVAKPTGRFLFQPQWLWASSDSTLQGTGFLIVHGGKNYGVTAASLMDFDAGGLTTATWLDIYSGEPVLTFRESVGRPLRTVFRVMSDTRLDFLLLVAPELRENCAPLELEFVERYSPGLRLWFPNKNADLESGVEWIDATLIEDAGNDLKVRLAHPVTWESQTGSPLLNAETGKVIGILHSREGERPAATTLIFCPARSLVRYLRRPPSAESITRSIRRR